MVSIQQNSLPKVVISILNWNGAAATCLCLEALKPLVAHTAKQARVEVVVMDNGSSENDWAALQAGVDTSWVSLLRQQENLGFAGGHNVVIRRVMAEATDFVWLLNNDAIVAPDTLSQLIEHMHDAPRCGAVSPVVVATHDSSVMDFCGAMHDWSKLDSDRPGSIEEAAKLQENFPESMWVVGTAVLYRTKALAESGLLDEGMFAYYEDDDMGARLAALGWSSRMAFNSTIRHQRSRNKPTYYYYLMARNSLRFWLRHTKPPHRRLPRLRLVSRSLLVAAKLRKRGDQAKSDACLLGTWDGLRGKSGPPSLNGRPPRWLVLASFLFPYRLQKILG